MILYDREKRIECNLFKYFKFLSIYLIRIMIEEFQDRNFLILLKKHGYLHFKD